MMKISTLFWRLDEWALDTLTVLAQCLVKAAKFGIFCFAECAADSENEVQKKVHYVYGYERPEANIHDDDCVWVRE
jgi:hypothetical protein